jgi:hypothetical protein
MALRMVALVRAKGGEWFARKVIPKDVQDEYARRFGMRWEAHLKLPAETPRPIAKVQLGEWIAEIETRIETLRADKRGEGHRTSKMLFTVTLATVALPWPRRPSRAAHGAVSIQ